VADGGGGVPVAAEVAAFERHVCGDDDLVPARRGEDGAVIADAETERAGAAGGAGGALADAVNPGELSFGDSSELAPGPAGRGLRRNAGRDGLGGHRKSVLGVREV
jgi:hypothetical protein